jgi:Ni2+-binding GTPase involved in maturation of urease and hydrogenase
VLRQVKHFLIKSIYSGAQYFFEHPFKFSLAVLLIYFLIKKSFEKFEWQSRINKDHRVIGLSDVKFKKKLTKNNELIDVEVQIPAKFKDHRDRVVYTRYNAKRSDIDWWKRNLGTFENLHGCRFFDVDIMYAKGKQSPIVLYKDILPSIAKPRTDLSFFEINLGTNMACYQEKIRLDSISTIGFFMKTGQGKTTLVLAVMADMAESTKPVFVVSCPKGVGDYAAFKRLYGEDCVTIDTSSDLGLKQFIDEMEEANQEIKKADYKVEHEGLEVSHHLDLPKSIKYRPKVFVMDDVTGTLEIPKSKGEAKRKELVEKLHSLTNTAVREWRSKLHRLILMTQEPSQSTLGRLPFSNIGLKYYGTIKQDLQKTTGLESHYIERRDFTHGKYLVDFNGIQKIVRTPFYGEAGNFNPWHSVFNHQEGQ